MARTQKKEKVTTNDIQSIKAKVALKDLFVSPKNVRTIHVVDEKKDAMTKNSIKQFGLINPLAVTAEIVDEKATGRYAVVAGGRRLSFLNELVAENEIAEDYEVDINIFDEADAVDISIIENATQKTMHAFDQFISYKSLIDSGKTLENIAVTHSVSVAHVKRCLCLANASPKILDEFKKGAVSNDQLMALCLTNDHATQENVWFNSGDYYKNPNQLKNAITADEIRADNRKVVFIGVENYIARGGRVREDLFSENGAGNSLMDVALVETMVQERLSKEADLVKQEGWGWIEFDESFDWEYTQKFSRVHKEERETLTEEEEALKASLEAEEEALSQEWDNFHSTEFETEEEQETAEKSIEVKQENLDERVEAFTNSLEEWPDGNGNLGILLCVSRSGELERMEGYCIREKKGSSTANSATDEPKGYSQSLVSCLNATRTEALQIELSKNVDLSLKLLAQSLLLKVIPHYQGWENARSNLTIDANLPKMHHNIPDYDESLVGIAKKAMIDKWVEILPKKSNDLLAWLLEAKQETVIEFIAFCSGFSLDMSYSTKQEDFKQLVELTGINMNEHFVPTADNFFGRISKADMTNVLDEVNKTVDADIEKTKKKDYAILVADAVMGTNWLPEQLKA